MDGAPPAKRQRAADTARDGSTGGAFADQPGRSWWQSASLVVGRLVLSRRQLLMVALLCIVAGLEPELPQEREAARNRRRMDHGTFVAHMSEPEFARYYRISSDRFRSILHDITPPARTLRKQRAAARRGGHGKTFVEYDVRLSMSLRYLAGGS